MTADAVRSLIEDLRSAIKRHDLDAFLACFDEQGMPVHRAERERAAAVLAPYEPGDGTEPPAAPLLAAARISSALTPACSQSVARSK